MEIKRMRCSRQFFFFLCLTSLLYTCESWARPWRGGNIKHLRRTRLSPHVQPFSGGPSSMRHCIKKSLYRLNTDLNAGPTVEENQSLDTFDDVSFVSKNNIKVSTSMTMPFSAEVAFDAFSDLERQPSWSNWLKSVEYIDPVDENGVDAVSGSRETKWTVSFRGISFSWTSLSTRLERPRLIEWESTSGMKNRGQVVFQSQGGSTRMTLQIMFVTPRFAAAIFRRSNAVASFVENRMLRSTLVNFCDVVLKQDLSQEIK